MKIFLEKFVLGVPEAKTFKTDKRSSFGIAFKVEGLKEGDEVYLVQDGEELELDEEIVEGYLTYSSTATETMEYVVEVLRDEKVVQEFRIKNVVVDSNEFFKDASGGDVTKEYVDAAIDDITTNPIHLTGEYEDGTTFGFNLYGEQDQD